MKKDVPQVPIWLTAPELEDVIFSVTHAPHVIRRRRKDLLLDLWKLHWTAFPSRRHNTPKP